MNFSSQNIEAEWLIDKSEVKCVLIRSNHILIALVGTTDIKLAFLILND